MSKGNGRGGPPMSALLPELERAWAREPLAERKATLSARLGGHQVMGCMMPYRRPRDLDSGEFTGGDLTFFFHYNHSSSMRRETTLCLARNSVGGVKKP